MDWEIIQGQTMRPNRVSHKSFMNTVLFVNATIGFAENLFLVLFMNTKGTQQQLHNISIITCSKAEM